MRTVKVVLPDSAFSAAELCAQQESVEVTALCSGLLTEILLADYRSAGHGPVYKKTSSADPTPHTENDGAASPAGRGSSFDVKSNFPEYPQRSIEIAQRLVDEVLKFKGVRTVWRNGRRIRFDPNFVDISYLLKQGRRRGVALSVYGDKTKFKDPPTGLRTGRTPSYSFALVESPEDLDKAIHLVHQAYELKEHLKNDDNEDFI